MALPQHFLDELLARTDIVELVSRYVPLKRKGGSMWGCCPFHHEKTPSFHVEQDKQFFKCFGCGEGGNTAPLRRDACRYKDLCGLCGG